MTLTPTFLDLLIVALLVAGIAYVLWGRAGAQKASPKPSQEAQKLLLTTSPAWLIKPKNYSQKGGKAAPNIEPKAAKKG